jgi:hypothetical protein
VPLLLRLAWLFGVALGLLWWLLRALLRAAWWAGWRLLLLGLALLVLPFSRWAARWLVRRISSGRGGRGGGAPGGRMTNSGGEPAPPARITLKPEPLQATARFGRSGVDWLADHLVGVPLVTSRASPW